MSIEKKISLDFNFAYGEPESHADFKTQNAAFIVEEDLGFTPSGEGEHIYLQVRKAGQNTHWVASQLASFTGVSDRDVGYAGRKDRHAITTQWFSIYSPKSTSFNWDHFQLEGVELLSVSKHLKKLKPGDHSSNHFVIRLCNITSIESLEERLLKVKQGVPNYFGEQRFGRGGSNLDAVQSLLIDRKPIRNKKQRGMVISAARSYLFNTVMSQRVDENNWQNLLSGESELSPSGPLWGRGRPIVSGEQLQLESKALEALTDWCGGLEHVGLQQERRELKTVPKNFQYELVDNQLTLSFSLLPGQFATGVLREIAIVDNKSSPG